MSAKGILSVILSALVLLVVEGSGKTISQDGKYKLFCYVDSWAYYRHGPGEFDVSQVDPNMCTHVVYTYAELHKNRIEPTSHYLDLPHWFIFFKAHDGYRKVNALKKKNPNLKTLISIGGWTTSSAKFSEMAAKSETRAIFAQSVVDFLQKYGFDGLDVDWQYPVVGKGGRPEDKINFGFLLRKLKKVLEPKGFLLTVSVSADKTIAESAYLIHTITTWVDFINLKSYNFHGPSENVTGFNAPLFAPVGSSKERSVDYATNFWLRRGAEREKLVLGLSTRGSSFTLAQPPQYVVGAKVARPGRKGPWTREEGTLGFNEICHNLMMRNGGWDFSFDLTALAPYAYKGDQWVGYDNHRSIGEKVDYLMAKGLAGGMMFIDTDDFRGSCYGQKFHLLSAAAKLLR